MRQIVLDTETTGLEPAEGHRVIEIGCYELQYRRPTGRTFHHYLNPDRDVASGAYEVHGIDDQFLADKPRFAEIAEAFVDFVRDAELIIHNAPFDVGFLDHELAGLGPSWGRVQDYCTVTDTLVLARGLHPGQRNSLDALCRRYGIDNAQRELHGALLDAQILADVFLAMTGGQAALSLGSQDDPDSASLMRGIRRLEPGRKRLRVISATDKERTRHEQWLTRLDEAVQGTCLWRRCERDADST